MRSRSYKFTTKVVPPRAGPVPPAPWNRGNSHVLRSRPRSRCGPAYSNCVTFAHRSNSSFETLPPPPSHSIICSVHVPTSHLPLFHPFFQLPFLFLQCCRMLVWGGGGFCRFLPFPRWRLRVEEFSSSHLQLPCLFPNLALPRVDSPSGLASQTWPCHILGSQKGWFLRNRCLPHVDVLKGGFFHSSSCHACLGQPR